MQPVTFRRNIGLFGAVMIGIGAMMGPGIIALPSELASMAGPLGMAASLRSRSRLSGAAEDSMEEDSE